jgi:hypothetical protein
MTQLSSVEMQEHCCIADKRCLLICRVEEDGPCDATSERVYGHQREHNADEVVLEGLDCNIGQMTSFPKDRSRWYVQYSTKLEKGQPQAFSQDREAQSAELSAKDGKIGVNKDVKRHRYMQ